MRLVATLASLAIAAAAASLPGTLVTMVGERSYAVRADVPSDDERGPAPGCEARTESEEDDDLDERLDHGEDLIAVLDHEAPTYVRSSAETSWPVHESRSPRAPHPETTLRPPIAA